MMDRWQWLGMALCLAFAGGGCGEDAESSGAHTNTGGTTGGSGGGHAGGGMGGLGGANTGGSTGGAGGAGGEDPGPLFNQFEGLTSWCKVEVHNHAGRIGGVAESVAAYKAAGFDLIFLTDHDYDEQLAPISDPDVVNLRGEEISEPRHGCALGLSAPLQELSFANIQEAIDAANAAGALYQINHPDRDDLPQDVVDPLTDLWAMEVGNSGTRWENAETLWDSQISQGKRTWGTFSDDAHSADDVGRGWIMVGTASDCSEQAVLASMAAGAFYASNGPTLTLSVSGGTISATTDGSSITWWRENMAVIKATNAAADSYTISGDEVFVRIDAGDADGNSALSMPLFLRE